MLKLQAKEANNLLLSLPSAEYGRLAGHLELVSLNQGELLSEFGQVPSHVYFPENALLSMWVEVGGDKAFLVGLLGREGLGNAICALDGQNALLRTLVLCSGSAVRMTTKDFGIALDASDYLRQTVLHYLSRLTGQIAQNSGCNHFHVTEQRLARWLLLARERLNSNNLYFTHETLGKLLACRRVGITTAASALKERQLIEYTRGYITILNLRGLQNAACSCYVATLDGLHAC
jgi:CRP-like cAMP-binding protein